MSGAFTCDQCEACCRTKLVDVFEVDLLREPRIGAPMQPLREPGLDGEIGYLNCLTNGACPFLDSECRCAIHSTRPVVCVLFPAGSDECREARRVFGIPPLEPDSAAAASAE